MKNIPMLTRIIAITVLISFLFTTPVKYFLTFFDVNFSCRQIVDNCGMSAFMAFQKEQAFEKSTRRLRVEKLLEQCGEKVVAVHFTDLAARTGIGGDIGGIL